ncbi:hypothetical protein PLIIFM63780_009763 [Purpureocillium lilacinum]|nr:hypothetical protein PLIIFM63780_009763 [Purpureocillium lilacinum]
MPKHNRSASGHPSHYAQMSSGLPSPLYSQQRVAIPASYYTIPGAPSSSMSQQLASQQQPQAQASFDPAAVAAASSYTTTTDPSAAAAATITAIPPGQHRPSSGAWSPQDDHQLVNARMQGLNWGQIKDTYFPAKTANACRKRHERLMERKGSDDWDGRKLQRLAKEYMGMRREIWSGLAARTGEKWSVVEQKCMSNGLKNLQSAARAASRRDRLETSGSAHSVTGYDDDSGISGIGLTPVDELDAPYGSPDATTGSSSASSYGGLTPSHYLHHHAQQQQQHHQQQHHHSQHPSQHQHRQAQHAHQQYQQHLQPHGAAAASYANVAVSTYGPAAVSYGHGYSSSVSSTASRTRYGTSEGSSPYMDAERLSGASDMGIGAVMNRSAGRG